MKVKMKIKVKMEMAFWLFMLVGALALDLKNYIVNDKSIVYWFCWKIYCGMPCVTFVAIRLVLNAFPFERNLT